MAENDKNPLEKVLPFFGGLVFVVLAIFITKIHKGQNQQPISGIVIDLIIGISFVITFLIAYRKKLMLAWWAAVLYLPATLSVGAVLHPHLTSWKALVIYVVMWLVFMCYLVQIYRPYKNFIDKAHPR